MKVYKSHLTGSYCAGLAIIYAQSIEEAITLLEDRRDYIGVEGQ